VGWLEVTFFMIDPNVVAHPEIARGVLEEGHEIGNHSWTHPQLSTFSDQRVTEEIRKTQGAIKNVCGFIPTLQRPPFAAIKNRFCDGIRRAGRLEVFVPFQVTFWRNYRPEIGRLLKDDQLACNQ